MIILVMKFYIPASPSQCNVINHISGSFFFFQTYFFTDQEDAEVNESLGRSCLTNLLDPN